ncbi:MAG: PH domain-containing protein, partial [Moraxellaceae bacterium]|nr:PH domain-containing protein [Moraxellaceae bacterium]
GGGQWIVLLCLSILCALKQSSTVAELSGVTLFLRDGILGQYAQTIPCSSIHTIWLRQNALMRLFDVGRVGMTTYEGKTYHSPLIQQPSTLKNVIIELAANRQPLWLPSDQQVTLDDTF